MKFEKVSLAQFTKDVKAYYPWLEDDAIEIMWQNITLPKRATAGSAGYDFYSPISVTMTQGVPVMIPTGIRVRIDRDKFLALVPRSGLGFKYGMRLSNTLGVIDFDYYGASKKVPDAEFRSFLSDIDAALKAAAALPANNQQNIAICALTGLRCDLFPTAAPYVPDATVSNRRA